MSLSGLDFFQTDYPLELALQGKALRLVTDPDKFEGITRADLTRQCGISGSIANDVLGVALAAERLIEKQDKVVCDLAVDEASHRTCADPIQDGCGCYTCSNYSVSYLFHLQEVKEMNFNILLAIHNVFTVDKLFEQIRAHQASPEYVAAFLVKNFVNIDACLFDGTT